MRRVALVTGASRGIGAAVAEGLAEDGAAVVGVHYHSDGAAATAVAERLRAKGALPILLRADLAQLPSATSASLAHEFLDEVEDAVGERRIDVLVNNAGLAHHCRFEDADEAALGRMMNINLAAPVFLVQALMEHFGKDGRVVNISTGMTRVAAPYQIGYAATKAALNSVTLSLAPILGTRDVTINAVLPGYVETDRTAAQLAEPRRRAFLASLSVFERIGSPDDIARIVRYLTSDGARWITGQLIDGTGGAGLLGGLPYPAE